MGSSAAYAQQDRDAHDAFGRRAAQPAVAPPGAARLDRAAGPAAGRAHVLELQRTVGNAAVGRMLKADRQALDRACCSACAAGRSCAADEEIENLRY